MTENRQTRRRNAAIRGENLRALLRLHRVSPGAKMSEHGKPWACAAYAAFRFGAITKHQARVLGCVL